MSQRLESLNGAVIVIVGASNDLSRGVALTLAEKGAKVVLSSKREAMFDDLVSEIEAKGGTAVAVQVNAGEASEAARLAEIAVTRFGRIDAWVNHMCVGEAGYFWDVPAENHGQLVEENLKSLIYSAHAALRQFRVQGNGTLIFTGSAIGKVPLALQATHAATKAAVVSLTHTLNDELRRAGDNDIRVGSLMPWSVDTPMWYHEANDAGGQSRLVTRNNTEVFADAILDTCLAPTDKQPVGW